MKKIFLLLLTICVLTGCKSKEERAEELLERELKKQLVSNDYEPLEKIEFQVSKAKLAYDIPINSISCWEYGLLCAKFEEMHDTPYGAALGKDFTNEPVYKLKDAEKLLDRTNKIGYEFDVNCDFIYQNNKKERVNVRAITNTQVDSLLCLELLEDPKFVRAKYFIEKVDNNDIRECLIWQ